MSNNDNIIRDNYKKLISEKTKLTNLEVDDLEIGVFNASLDYSNENKILIYGGSVHFSKDFLIEKGNECYGYVYYANNFWDTSKKIGYIESLSQEHGIIKLEKKGKWHMIHDHLN